ncbi:MAG TPA: HNH endonuclease signature motif containing protein, partial [Thermoanaerobaculia bacterium]|nr:HNH endonuclease signature motif containing protein [Thermoanaerobaculia bacterium]
GTVTMVDGADGEILSVGRKTRTVPPSIRRALERRDRGCRFPGCGARFCDAHHVEHWADGGETSLENLLLLCRRHHRAVHEEGFTVELLRDGAARFRRPDGRLLPAAPAPPALPADPVDALVRRHERAGIEIGPETALPGWSGEPFELGTAVTAFLEMEEAVAGRGEERFS